LRVAAALIAAMRRLRRRSTSRDLRLLAALIPAAFTRFAHRTFLGRSRMVQMVSVESGEVVEAAPYGGRHEKGREQARCQESANRTTGAPGKSASPACSADILTTVHLCGQLFKPGARWRHKPRWEPSLGPVQKSIRIFTREALGVSRLAGAIGHTWHSKAAASCTHSRRFASPAATA